ncbi:MAG: MFS transporter [Clostridia bacterium]|nr:MFS transporter [Clostridia bacterium]
MESKTKSYGRLKAACYTSNIAMSAVTNLAPILFLSFKELYGISFAMLGLLVAINFTTQLIVDLLLSLFSHKLNMSLTVKLTPVITAVGLLVFAAAPLLFPASPFIGLVIGTVIYAASGGLVEVLISPVIAAIPSDDPDREVSKLHSSYAWGCVASLPLLSLFILGFGGEAWQILTLICALIPITGAILYLGTELPELKTPERIGGAIKQFKNPALWFSVLAIFLGGATECTMSQWASGYIEAALGIDKIWGDIFGVTLFAVMLGIGRTLYSKYGKSPEPILFFGSLGSVVCYLVAALSPSPIISLIACAMTGLCASMLWPGTLIYAADRIPSGGVLVYAMMAAGGDLGASVGPQLVGAVADIASASGWLGDILTGSAEAVGMRVGMLAVSVLPILAACVYAVIYRRYRQNMQIRLDK